MRLFFALWPDDGVRHALAAWQRRCLPKAVRATHVQDLHMTLHFLGQVESSRLDALLGLGGRLRLPAFDLCLDRLGHWPGPAVLWAGSSRVPEALQGFHAELEDSLALLGFAREKRSYHPHVTLARKVRHPLIGVGFSPLTWRVRAWALLESRPGMRPLYHPLASWHAES